MKLVILESPYAGDTERNEAYARRAMKDCLLRGEAPFASHLLYMQPGILDDTIPDQRSLGIAAGLLWGREAEITVVYVDYDISDGMRQGIDEAIRYQKPVEYRTIGKVPV